MDDAAIIGGGPAGLSAALALGRARKRVVLFDAGPRRNARATHIHGFVTRDGTPPDDFRRIAREQLEPYGVDVRDDAVEAIRGERGNFEVQLASGTVRARRILLCTGMIDVLPEIDGLREQWGRTIFICPYCHAWEVQDRRFGLIASNVELLEHFATLLLSWTGEVVVFPNGAFDAPAETPHRVEPRRIRRIFDGGVELEDGTRVELGAIFIRPPQRQVPVVASLGWSSTRTVTSSSTSSGRRRSPASTRAAIWSRRCRARSSPRPPDIRPRRCSTTS